MLTKHCITLQLLLLCVCCDNGTTQDSNDSHRNDDIPASDLGLKGPQPEYPRYNGGSQDKSKPKLPAKQPHDPQDKSKPKLPAKQPHKELDINKLIEEEAKKLGITARDLVRNANDDFNSAVEKVTKIKNMLINHIDHEGVKNQYLNYIEKNQSTEKVFLAEMDKLHEPKDEDYCTIPLKYVDIKPVNKKTTFPKLNFKNYVPSNRHISDTAFINILGFERYFLKSGVETYLEIYEEIKKGGNEERIYERLAQHFGLLINFTQIMKMLISSCFEDNNIFAINFFRSRLAEAYNNLSLEAQGKMAPYFKYLSMCLRGDDVSRLPIIDEKS